MNIHSSSNISYKVGKLRISVASLLDIEPIEFEFTGDIVVTLCSISSFCSPEKGKIE